MFRERRVWCERLTGSRGKTTLECPLIGNGDSVIIRMSGMDLSPCKQGGTAMQKSSLDRFQ